MYANITFVIVLNVFIRSFLRLTILIRIKNKIDDLILKLNKDKFKVLSIINYTKLTKLTPGKNIMTCFERKGTVIVISRDPTHIMRPMTDSQFGNYETFI